MAIVDPDIGAQLSTGTGRAFFRPGVFDYVPPSEELLAAHRTALDLGEPQTGTMTQDAGTRTDTRTKRRASRDIIKSSFEGATRTIAFSSLSIVKQNIALFLNGEIVEVTQSTDAVTDEKVFNVDSNTFFTLGRTTSAIAGVRGASAISLTSQPSTLDPWAASTSYSAGDVVQGTAATDMWMATTSGTSGGTEPTWTATIGDTVTDNDITWELVSTSAVTFTEDTDYQVDSDADDGLLFRWISGTDYRVIFANYTPASVKYDQIATGEDISQEGSFLFIADWVNKESWWYAPKVTLVPTGDLSFVTESDTQQELGFEMTLATVGNLRQLYYLGKPTAV